MSLAAIALGGLGQGGEKRDPPSEMYGGFLVRRPCTGLLARALVVRHRAGSLARVLVVVRHYFRPRLGHFDELLRQHPGDSPV